MTPDTPAEASANKRHTKSVEPSGTDVSIMKAEEFKEVGNEFFKNGDLKKAMRNYYRGVFHVKGKEFNPIMMLSGTQPQTGVLSDSQALYVKLQNNIAACLLKMEPVRYERAKICCQEITKLDPKNGKAWYRLSLSHFHLEETDKALSTIKEAQKLTNNKDSAIINLYKQILEQIKMEEKNEANLFRNNDNFKKAFSNS